MNAHAQKDVTRRLVGYTELVARYGIDALPNWHRSLVASSGTRRVESAGGVAEETYPAKYWPGDTLGDQLEFALKYDGMNLGILACLFRLVSTEEILTYVTSRPTGKYARRLWFLYEWVTGTALPVEDLKTGNYIDLADPDETYTVSEPRQIRRQRINDNLLGDRRFCPTVRRTEALRALEKADLPDRCRKIVAGYSPALLKRAMSYLYTKETKSSFEIEHITPSPTRTERFVALLQLAEIQDFCAKAKLIDLQNRTVDPRFRDTDYRTGQNYIGESFSLQKEIVHYVCPKPEDLGGLMEGLVAAHARLSAGQVPAVIHAAAVAYGFVFLHPFEDGNGRIHRFLIHNILIRRGFTPAGIIFPVSAVMLKNLADYDASLESFSKALLSLVDYSLDEEGRMTVRNETADFYRYLDLTPQAEALARFIAQTVDSELVDELAFLADYDRIKKALQDIVDMPDQRIDLFIRSCLQNSGRLSVRKRASHFAQLSDEEVAHMEEAVSSARSPAQ